MGGDFVLRYRQWSYTDQRARHGLIDSEIRQAATVYLISYPLDDGDPVRELRLGFDTKGRLLEVVVLLLDDDRQLAIHAMKARQQYLDLLPPFEGR